MRDISCCDITDAIEQLCIRAATVLTPDMAAVIDSAYESEPSQAGKSALMDIVENYRCAARDGLPICQDTGMAVVFADIGQDVHITGGDFQDAVNEGVRRGYVNGYLRKSVVADPFRRVNTEDNTPAVLHVRIVPGDKLSLTVAPKGFGSENRSAMKMFLPSASVTDYEDFIVDVVRRAGADPCPPIVVGVGIGGTVEKAAELAKRGLIRSVDEPNPDPFYEQMEQRTLKKINKLGIGPQGFGGRNTALAVNISAFAAHIAGTSCVVNIGCHATRHASCEL
ncbi:MAG: fumarate hydratase [Oscillospiraceae bacterium]